MSVSRRMKQVIAWPILPHILGIAGALIYSVQSVVYMFTQKSMIDEGLFLYKGYLFASGIYRPFQDYGPWMQKAPLVYLIPGYVEIWFGPGLRAGRYYAILVSLLFLLGLWLVTRRLAGSLWAGVVICAVALNPSLIKAYSIAISQGLTSCLLVWTLFFALGKDRHLWKLAVSTFLVAILVFTRQNMIVVAPLLLGYILWEHGWRKALWALVPFVIVFLIVDGIYWPGILKMWAPLFPTQITHFLDPWRAPRGISAAWEVRPSFITQIGSFFNGVRFNLSELAGGAAVLLFWPPRRSWKSPSQFRVFVFLIVSFIVLTGVHLWVGTGNSDANNYNAWAFSLYLAFFSWLGLLLVAVSVPLWKEKISTWQQVFAGLFIVIATAGVGYASFETFGYDLIEIQLPRILSFFRTGHIPSGGPKVWALLGNMLGMDYYTSRWVVPMLVGLLAGIVILLVAFGLWQYLRTRTQAVNFYSYGSFAVIVFLVTSSVLAPTRLLSGDDRQYDCGVNVIRSFDQVGRELAAIVPLGSKVYWDGGNATALLLYIPGIRIYPQQLDENWSYWQGGNADALARFGFWNEELMRQWQQEANIFIIQQSNFDANWQQFLDSDHFNELTFDQIPLGCSPDTYLRVFIRN
jgi:hypothetical protein